MRPTNPVFLHSPGKSEFHFSRSLPSDSIYPLNSRENQFALHSLAWHSDQQATTIEPNSRDRTKIPLTEHQTQSAVLNLETRPSSLNQSYDLLPMTQPISLNETRSIQSTAIDRQKAFLMKPAHAFDSAAQHDFTLDTLASYRFDPDTLLAIPLNSKTSASNSYNPHLDVYNVPSDGTGTTQESIQLEPADLKYSRLLLVPEASGEIKFRSQPNEQCLGSFISHSGSSCLSRRNFSSDVNSHCVFWSPAKMDNPDRPTSAPFGTQADVNNNGLRLTWSIDGSPDSQEDVDWGDGNNIEKNEVYDSKQAMPNEVSILRDNCTIKASSTNRRAHMTVSGIGYENNDDNNNYVNETVITNGVEDHSLQDDKSEDAAFLS
ncbi:unnamed protein product [Protopolystoma xenopodis]|uniref:Uncharacterized protein n=1 Tax=Protopolystoma xenopodis TaxID=117903 RepID=A0A3S5A1X8_9PLAT|nr:unnamed protein product [Protopolystoma xenopodis]